MKNETIIERLVEARGVGRWTVEMFLMFTLGRPDVLPVDDYGIRLGYKIAYGKRILPKPKALAKIRRALGAVSHDGVVVPVAGGGPRTVGTQGR